MLTKNKSMFYDLLFFVASYKTKAQMRQFKTKYQKNPES